VEDAVSRKAVQRRLLADLEQLHQLSQHTLQDLFYPQLTDNNGYLWPASASDKKKKEKVNFFYSFQVSEQCGSVSGFSR